MKVEVVSRIRNSGHDLGSLRSKEDVLDFLTERIPDRALRIDSVYDLVVDNRALLILLEELSATDIVDRIEQAQMQSSLVASELYVIVRRNKMVSEVVGLIEGDPSFEEVYIVPSFPSDLDFVVYWLQGLEVNE